MKFKLLFLLLLPVLTSKGQFAFDVVFNNTVAQGLPFPYTNQLVLKGYIKNSSGSNDIFIWQLTKGAMPPTWTIRVMDKNQTHDSSVTSSSFSLADNDSAEIRILLDSAMASGQCSLTLTVSRQSDPFDLVEVELFFHILPISTGEITVTSASVYPNPATNQLFVQLPTEEYMVMKIYSALGQDLLTHYHNNTTSTIDIEALPAGVYTLRYTGADGVNVSKQFIKL